MSKDMLSGSDYLRHATSSTSHAGSSASPSLLGENEPPPVTIVNRGGTSPFVLIADHAGGAIPAVLGDLGLAEADRRRHIALDIGVDGLARLLAVHLDAALILQHYSRLVVDCNRDPGRPDAVPEASDGTAIPGNAGLSEAQRHARVEAIHTPYQQTIADTLARRDGAGQPSILVALHSFTPVMGGDRRRWDAGILHNGADDRFAHALLRVLRARPDLVIGDNEPYTMDGTDHSVPRHAFAARRPYAELEIRQDLITDPAGQRHWADLLARALREAAGALHAAPAAR